MKVVCPVCNQFGILEERGNSQRIIHYQYLDGKRILTKHKVSVGTSGNKMGTEKADPSSFSKFMAGPMGFEPMTFSLEG